MNLDALWTNLESGGDRVGREPGVTVRRIDAQSQEDLFVGVRQPAGTRLLLLKISSLPRLGDGPLIQSRGFTTGVNRFSGDAGHLHLFIESAGASFNEVFGHVAGDVAEHVFSRRPPEQALPVFLGRLDRWKRFFESAGGDSLSEIAVQGLLAELLFLRDFAVPAAKSAHAAVASWAVPEPLSKDFQFAKGAVEVKGSASREHTKVRINGERQLDPTGFEVLYLLAVLLEPVVGAGFTLPETIASVRELLGRDMARDLFEEKLIEFGCLDLHFPRYNRRYLLQRCRAFHVRDGFPRVPTTLPNGVGDLNYTVALSACVAFEIELEAVRTLIRESL